MLGVWLSPVLSHGVQPLIIAVWPVHHLPSLQERGAKRYRLVVLASRTRRLPTGSFPFVAVPRWPADCTVIQTAISLEMSMRKNENGWRSPQVQDCRVGTILCRKSFSERSIGLSSSTIVQVSDSQKGMKEMLIAHREMVASLVQEQVHTLT